MGAPPPGQFFFKVSAKFSSGVWEGKIGRFPGGRVEVDWGNLQKKIDLEKKN